MAPGILSVLLLSIFSTNVIGSGLGTDDVPVLFWSPESAMTNLPDMESYDVVQQNTFRGEILTPLMKRSHSAVVFLQDKLHMDDFTKYADVYSVESDGGAFKNIKSLMEENFSLELPQVSEASKSVEELKSDFPGAVHSVSSLEEFKALDLPVKSRFLLFVYLSPTDGSVDPQSVIAKNDEMIGSVCDGLTKKGVKYTALFTGEKASKGMVEEGEVHSGRHLLADPAPSNATSGTLMNITTSDGDMFVFMKSIGLCVKNKTVKGCDLSFNLIPDKEKTAKGSKSNSTANIELSFPKAKANNGTSEHDVTIKMDMINRKDSWIITQITLVVGPGAGSNVDIKNGTLLNPSYDFVVPALYSWHCTEAQLVLETIRAKDLKEYAGTNIKINGFQIQPFNIQQNRFFNAVDCVGFFTTGIWMGLFVVGLLLVILITGTRMLLSLSIMDRYDDPKGKTISVSTGGAD